MAKNKLSDLRDHLFEVIEGLKDAEKPMALDRAKAICDVGQTLINVAKVEVDLVRAMDGRAPGRLAFFDISEESREVPRIEGK